MSGHISRQSVTRFLQAALECSIYTAPTEPGLTYDELVEAGTEANFLPGEINDSIPHVTTQTLGGRSKRLLLSQNMLSLLMIFVPRQEPEYRDIEAFGFVFDQLRLSARRLGAQNAKVDRSIIMDQADARQLQRQDIEVVLTIMRMNDIIVDDGKSIRFVPGKEAYGSPDQQLRSQGHLNLIRKDALARAYPIVKNIVERRTEISSQNSESISNEQMHGLSRSFSNKSLQPEWISSADAIALVGYQYTRAICKRAHAGLVKARAERFFQADQSSDNVDVPTEFWWAQGEAALKQNWISGDFETWIDQRLQLKAFGVTFWRLDIERIKPNVTPSSEKNREAINMPTPKHIFLGHGHSLVWLALKDFLQDRLNLTVDEFNRVPTAGVATASRLEEMLDSAAFAILILTAEDQQADGTNHARLNVVHEAGLFQGRLGLKRAIIMLEDGCEEFSNIYGLGQLRFSKNRISTEFEEIRRVLERENIL